MKEAGSSMRNILLLLLAAFLAFAGPTYIMFVLLTLIRLNYFVSIICGLVLFLAGLALILYMTKNRTVS